MFYEIKDVLETTRMITQNNLDVRTITMGIRLRDCADPDVKVCARKIYDKITDKARNLVKVGEQLELGNLRGGDQRQYEPDVRSLQDRG